MNINRVRAGLVEPMLSLAVAKLPEGLECRNRDQPPPDETSPARWLGYFFARRYAAWCTNQMTEDALNHFAGATLK